MWETTEKNRKSQRMVTVLALAILLGLLVIWPAGGGFADWMNAQNAPSDESTRYTEITSQTGVTFNMDSTQFKTSGSYKSQYVWKNTTGYVNYNNVTHTAGVISVTEQSTAGNNVSVETSLSWAQMYPEFRIWFDYTAKAAYKDNVVRIRLYISGIYVSAHSYARTITLSAGGITFYTTSIAKDETKNYIDENITVNVNDLRRAIIADGDLSYFKLVITAQDTTLTIANSAMYCYNVNKWFQRDDGLFFVGAFACAITFAGIFLVQPKYSLPFGKKGGPKKGGW